jgi:hypothetical protein
MSPVLPGRHSAGVFMAGLTIGSEIKWIMQQNLYIR